MSGKRRSLYVFGAEEMGDDDDPTHVLPSGIFSIESIRFQNMFLGRFPLAQRPAIVEHHSWSGIEHAHRGKAPAGVSEHDISRVWHPCTA